jgi:transcriptional regulator with XRE-family HTH domain
MPRSKKSYLSVLELRAWRDILHLTQAEAAYLLGMSTRQYSNFENGLSSVTKSIKLSCVLISVACEEFNIDNLGFSDIREIVDNLADSYFPEEC